MNALSSVPVLPESAPFTPEQRAYLNGFFAGLFSRQTQGQIPSRAPEKPLLPLTVLFGSQTGSAEKLAKRLAKEAVKRGFAPNVEEMGKYPVSSLSPHSSLLLVTSTYGDGEPPDNAKAFWNSLVTNPPSLAGVKFSICALGDQNYPQFCAFGRALDERLEKLGAQRIYPRQDCDVEFEAIFSNWLEGVLGALHGETSAGANPRIEISALSRRESAEESGPSFCKERPFASRLLLNRPLSLPGSAKDVRHLELDLSESGIVYEAGDALGVWPSNDPCLVEELLTALRFSGEELVSGKGAEEIPIRTAFLRCYEITRIPRSLLDYYAKMTGDDVLSKVTSPTANGELHTFLWGREVIDLVLDFPQVTFAPQQFIGLLRKLQPRLYSIASSAKAHPGQVHLCVGTVRYQSFGRSRAGVASTFLADRVQGEAPVPIFVHANPAFRPRSPEAPLIMIGPGTGIAPFRAFLEERRATGAPGRNWLFFGEQHSALDFLYGEEISRFHEDGLLDRLDLAWSRDQETKVYVQHKMLEHAKELFSWLEEGASLCVCGDASRMAKDVDEALHRIVANVGGKSAAEAAEYVKRLAADKRYLRDVY